MAFNTCQLGDVVSASLVHCEGTLGDRMMSHLPERVEGDLGC